MLLFRHEVSSLSTYRDRSSRLDDAVERPGLLYRWICPPCGGALLPPLPATPGRFFFASAPLACPSFVRRTRKEQAAAAAAAAAAATIRYAPLDDAATAAAVTHEVPSEFLVLPADA